MIQAGISDSVSRLDGVFLDFYGTVASGDRAAVVAICEKIAADHALTLSGEALAGIWGQRYFAAIESEDESNFRRLVDLERDTLLETMSLVGAVIEPEPYITMFNAYLTRPTLFEEVPETLSELRVPVCIVSNADDRELLAAVEHLGLEFHAIVTSEAARSYKPDARIFHKALEVTGWRPERVIHVGDSLHSDVGGARKLGIRTAWVNRAERMLDIGTHTPDFTWPDLRPLLTLCRNGGLSQ